ncbi:MAG: UDP-N-acetylmuramoyl-tripeptide--D-alanyl-D-alanine ligase [Betaproteobacteria bacterium CG2_30_59_46]|nr:MAG: UDP-N-acetylmuramoyl-tripeptide--D-alanyl-D-alanine ligase [Betaproteobacteria bacterium CG2_30_59_46]PIQ14074.1 MAG: UDP-N-acetylmuramoyl-tripeptide--D-alanyl-D-alanine ligase [Hydrogenophilales bacterium CG18_big_fil_WC_8_21_14_2_50_58_12]PIY01893.1 MAG: UDP-N-acetylmuramoyl-tripeptide--D-alanyl-D-alanine ligase [Hydrogenophilales bacterium CG_4_10_14_3_um_filter_58_23]PJB07375.1 MAG: UDP-N-acetylmuramoyl-tripeptide--D-alanyl-D-alanine ligase [Hydrogenophilales bacterium CG_4_9_14_3_um
MLSLSAAAKAINAETSGADVTFYSVTTDSRAVVVGDLFVALKGERFDGHNYVKQVMEQGAVAALVERRDPAWGDFPLLVVKDARLALGELAAHWRSRFTIPVVALTGSSGKTTVKEMIAAILREQAGDQAVLATKGNLNNDIGMPLTLLGLRDTYRYAVIEMGMNHPGEIAYLSGIAKPDVALILNAQAAHLAGLGTVEAVARAKGEIFQGLAANGAAVINADDPHAALWQELAAGHRIIRFGLEQPAELSASFELQSFGSEIEMATPTGKFAVALPVPGEHNVRNALAAAAVAQALGVDNATIAAGLAKVASVKGRLRKSPCLHGATLIDDTYNANPASVRVAIAVLAGLPGKKVLVLGDMGELGENARALHAEIGAAAKAAGVDLLFTLGDLSAAAAQAFGEGGRHFEYIEDLLHEIENLLAPEVTVLVKGSRFMQMERVVKSFVKEDMACCSH